MKEVSELRARLARTPIRPETLNAYWVAFGWLTEQWGVPDADELIDEIWLKFAGEEAPSQAVEHLRWAFFQIHVGKLLLPIDKLNEREKALRREIERLSDLDLETLRERLHKERDPMTRVALYYRLSNDGKKTVIPRSAKTTYHDDYASFMVAWIIWLVTAPTAKFNSFGWISVMAHCDSREWEDPLIELLIGSGDNDRDIPLGAKSFFLHRLEKAQLQRIVKHKLALDPFTKEVLTALVK